jgi:hypothetical protein
VEHDTMWESDPHMRHRENGTKDAPQTGTQLKSKLKAILMGNETESHIGTTEW